MILNSTWQAPTTMTYRFWLPVMSWTNLLPRSGTALEIPECLRKLQWLHHYPLLLLVESDLRVARQWEVLAQWVSVETVVGHDSTQIGVVDEEDSEEIVDFSLVPVGAIVQTRDGWHGCRLVGVGLHPDAGVVADGEQVVDDLKALVARRVVDSRDVADLGKFGSGMVFEEGEGWHDARGRDVDGELVLPYGESRFWSAYAEQSSTDADIGTHDRHTAEYIWADMTAGIVHMRGGSVPCLGIYLHGSFS